MIIRYAYVHVVNLFYSAFLGYKYNTVNGFKTLYVPSISLFAVFHISFTGELLTHCMLLHFLPGGEPVISVRYLSCPARATLCVFPAAV